MNIKRYFYLSLYYTLYVLITAVCWLVFIVPFLLAMNIKLVAHALTYGLKDPFDMWRVVSNDL